MAEGADAQEYPRIHDDDAEAPGQQGSSAFPAEKADLQKRFVAAVIDAVVAVVVGFIPFVGGIVATAYWLVRDGMDIEFMDRRSLGKKVMKLRPVTASGTPMDIEDSIKRNWPFGLIGVSQILLFIPILGWLLLIPVMLGSIALALFEVFLVITEPQGRRIGDKFAETMVVEVPE